MRRGRLSGADPIPARRTRHHGKKAGNLVSPGGGTTKGLPPDGGDPRLPVPAASADRATGTGARIATCVNRTLRRGSTPGLPDKPDPDAGCHRCRGARAVRCAGRRWTSLAAHAQYSG